MIQLLTNVRLAANTVLQHLTDDPMVLSLQLSRRLPASVVHPAARLVCAIAPEELAGRSRLARVNHTG